MRDLYKELMDIPAPKWPKWKYWSISEPGRILVGRVIAFTYCPHTGRRDGVLVETDEGRIVCVELRYPHLSRQIDNLSVREGDRIGIKHFGRSTITRQEEFHVIVDREEHD